MRPSFQRKLYFIAFLASLFTVIPFLLLFRVEALCSFYPLETDESNYYLPNREWLVPLSLGYREAAAGATWTSLLVYFGEQHEVRGHFDYLESYLVAVTTLDPFFYRAYTWGSVAALYNGTLIDRDAVDMSVRMLERGLRIYPDDGELHYYLGFQLYFEMPPVSTSQEAENFRRIGTEEICTAALLGGGPPYLPLVCSSLAERRGLDSLAQERLLQTLFDTDDERTRLLIEERLESLMNADTAFRVIQRIQAERIRWLAEMPYVPSGLYALIGPRPTLPATDQVDLPLPMDAMIAASYEELFDGDDASEIDEEEGAHGQGDGNDSDDTVR